MKISDNFDNVGVGMVGRLEGDETVEINVVLKFEDYGLDNLYQFMYVWGGINDDDDSHHMYEKMIDHILDVERDWFKDPSNKMILSNVHGDQRCFSWFYSSEETDNLNLKLTTPTPEEIRKYIKEFNED